MGLLGLQYHHKGTVEGIVKQPQHTEAFKLLVQGSFCHAHASRQRKARLGSSPGVYKWISTVSTQWWSLEQRGGVLGSPLC